LVLIGINNKHLQKSITLTPLTCSSLQRIGHKWITVVNPINHRTLLQACDDCGVVKSENSIVRDCKAIKGSVLISRSLSSHQQIAV